MKRRSVVAVANEKVPIATVLRLLGVHVEDETSHRKVHCPFGFYHSDGGKDRTVRLYGESNSAYCFSCTQQLRPVDVWAAAHDLDRRTAASQLLDLIGYRPLDVAAQFAQELAYEPVPDTAQLAQALQTYCCRIQPDWVVVQFDPVVAAVLTRCLALLDQVSTAEHAQVWLAGAKRAMHRALVSPSASSEVWLEVQAPDDD